MSAIPEPIENLQVLFIRQGEIVWSLTRRHAGVSGIPPTIAFDPAEWDYGNYTRLTSIGIRHERSNWGVFRDGCHSGETPEQIANRAHRVIAKLSYPRGKVVLFSHGQFGSVLAARWIGLPVVEVQHFSLGPELLNILGFNPDHAEIPLHHAHE